MQADNLIKAEMVRLLYRDASKYPIDGSAPRSSQSVLLEDFSDELMQRVCTTVGGCVLSRCCIRCLHGSLRGVISLCVASCDVALGSIRTSSIFLQAKNLLETETTVVRRSMGHAPLTPNVRRKPPFFSVTLTLISGDIIGLRASLGGGP